MGKSKHHRHNSNSSSEFSDSEPSPKRYKKTIEKKQKKKKLKKKCHKDKEQERLLKEAKAFLKKKLKAGDLQASTAAVKLETHCSAEAVHRGDVVPITLEDYYNRNAEFAVWLHDTRGQFFNELSSEEAHKMFAELFVPCWNAGKLPAKFYSGIAAKTTQRTAFKWSFKGGAEHINVESLGMAAAVSDDVKVKEQEVAQMQNLKKKKAVAEREWLDEIMPKASGREALVEKKKARREAARAPDDSPMRVSGGGDVMGGDDSFQAAKSRELKKANWRQRQVAAKQEVLHAKLAQAQAEEDAKLDKFRTLLAKGPLQIQKRR